MQVYFNVLGYEIPSYGFFILLGGILANLIAFYVLKKTKQDINDFILLEAYVILGGYLGSKILYLIVSYKEIEWNRLTDMEYLARVMTGGFVFYGGVILGIIFVFLFGKLHKIDYVAYMKNFIFLVPFVHAFGRIGCYMSGCCYGARYDGWGSVMFPEDCFAPSGVRLFPVQIVEAGFLLFIAFILGYWRFAKKLEHVVELYLILYGILRFALEYCRADEARGRFLFFSTSQWISIMMIIIAIAVWCWRKKCGKTTVSF